MSIRYRCVFRLATLAVLLWTAAALTAETKVDNPFLGITHITRTEDTPRNVTMHILKIDLTAPGLSFKLTPPGGSQETVRQTTLEFLKKERAQIAVNAHFFLPFPSTDRDASVIGLAVSNGDVFSGFEEPAQSYAMVNYAPALNIDNLNHASIIHHDAGFADGKHVIEDVTLWNTVAGSAQIITDGLKSIPVYADEQNVQGLLVPGGPVAHSNGNSWYALADARTVAGLTEDNQTLILFTVDNAGGSEGMSLAEVADLLISDYNVHNAINLDGGGSTTLAMEDPVSYKRTIVNTPSDESYVDTAKGRAVASNLAIFASSVQ